MASKYRYRYRSKNPKNTYEYTRQRLYEVDINDLRTEQQLRSYITKSAQLVEEEARRGIELLSKGRTTEGTFSQIRISNPTMLQSVQEKAQQILEQEYVGIPKREIINYLKQEAGKARQLLGYKTGTYEETVRGYKSFIDYIKKYTGEDITYKEAEKLVPILERAYTSPTSRFNRLMYATQTQEIIQTIEQMKHEKSMSNKNISLLDILQDNEEEIYERLGITTGAIEITEVDDSDVIPIFKGNS